MSGTDDTATATEVAELKAKIAKLEDDVEKWKNNSRKNEDRAKENADAAKELEELKAADKSESQRAADKAAAEAKRANEAEARELRLEVAIDKAPDGMGIAQIRKLAKRLTGTNRDELEADADELFSDFTPATGEETGEPGTGDQKNDPGSGDRRTPKEDLKSGNSGGGGGHEAEPDVAKVAAEVPRLY